MADIRVEEKRGSANWIWIVIALVVLAVIAWFLFAQPRTTGEQPLTAPADTIPASLEWRTDSPLMQRIA
jgi:bacteriorhodopsin